MQHYEGNKKMRPHKAPHTQPKQGRVLSVHTTDVTCLAVQPMEQGAVSLPWFCPLQPAIGLLLGGSIQIWSSSDPVRLC